MKLPTIRELSALIRDVKTDICDEYRETKDSLPNISLTVGWNDQGGSWGFQTGDNSFTGGAYHFPHWGVVNVYRRSDSRELAREIRAQLAELVIY